MLVPLTGKSMVDNQSLTLSCALSNVTESGCLVLTLGGFNLFLLGPGWSLSELESSASSLGGGRIGDKSLSANPD